jgi:hypothetical protein
MKLNLCILAILSPALCLAQLAGNWTGVITSAQGAHRILLHVSGPYTAMKATAEFPDQEVSNAQVDSITFSDSTLQFSVPALEARYSGVLNDAGNIVGTLTQRGTGIPLTLARVADTPSVQPDIPSEGSVTVENGRFYHKPSGVEFDMPSGWSVNRTQFSGGGPGESTILQDASGKATVVSIYILKVPTDPDNIPKVLAGVIPRLIAMRAGQTGGPRQMTPNYTVRESSVDQSSIGGHQAVRAIGDFTRGDKSFSELLAWIDTENTRTYFFLRSLAKDLPDVEAPFNQMLQSAKIP